MAAPPEQRIAWLENEVAVLTKLCRRLVDRLEWAGREIEDVSCDVSRLKRWGPR